MKYDFDTVYDRRNTNSLKWDFAAERHHSEDELPLWVADMDLKAPEPIIKAMHDLTDTGFYGYTLDKHEDRQIVSDWLKRRHGHFFDPDDILFTPGVVYGLTQAMLALTDPGDAVMISEPVYYPFGSLVRDNGRTLIRHVLSHNDNGYYYINFEDFETQIVRNNVKVYILCSPHNPVGRVWTESELKKAGDICFKHGVTVFSDEIHADFVYEDNKHIPFASISPEFEERSVTFTSPSKTFNIAGLQVAEVIAHDEKKRNAIRQAISATGYAEVSAAGFVAMKAAYTECDEWVDSMVSYIYDNIRYMEGFISSNLPTLHMTHPEGTYLPWVDCSGLGLDKSGLEDLIRNKAKLWLDAGHIFGTSGTLFQRFNVACPRKTVEEAMDRLLNAVKEVTVQ